MNKAKVIKICPVCHSKNIEQKIETFGFEPMAIVGTGSFCRDCGVEFAFNSNHLKRELNKEMTAIKQGREQALKSIAAT